MIHPLSDFYGLEISIKQPCPLTWRPSLTSPGLDSDDLAPPLLDSCVLACPGLDSGLLAS